VLLADYQFGRLLLIIIPFSKSLRSIHILKVLELLLHEIKLFRKKLAICFIIGLNLLVLFYLFQHPNCVFSFVWISDNSIHQYLLDNELFGFK